MKTFIACKPSVGAGLFCLLVMGCSETRRYPVSGVVTIHGAPAALTTVIFRPADADADPRMAGKTVTDDKGNFTIGGPDNAGLPAGEYKVTFSQTLVNGKPAHGSGGKKSEMIAGEKEAVPDDYRDPSKTPISAKVSGSTNTFTFDIQ